MSFIACNLNKDIFETSLLITGSNIDQSYYIPNNTPVRFLNKSRVKHGLPALAKHIYHQKPHIVIGAIGHVNFTLSIMALFFRKVKFIGRETIVASAIHGLKKKKHAKSLLPDLRPITLAKIICQSKDMQEDLVSNYGYPRSKLVIIANPVTARFMLKNYKKENETLQLVTVGRLTKQKGYIRILDVLAKFKIPFHYTIIGSGSEKETILSHAKKLHLFDKITHVPFTDTVENYLAKSDLFLSGSYVEGFPNSLIESCAVGTPVIAFEAPGGINEIIFNGINGYIATDENEFLEKLIFCSTKSWNPETIRQSVMKKYSEKIILDKYEALFLSLTE